MFAPAVRSPAMGCLRGDVLVCWGQLLAPDPVSAHGQQLFSTGHLEAPGLAELGDGDVAVPWAWDEVAPRRGDLHVQDGQGPLCSSLRAPTNPPGAAAPALRRSQDIQGLSPGHRSGGASATLQRSPRGRRTGSKAISMANSCWERGLLTICHLPGEAIFGGGWEASFSRKGFGLRGAGCALKETVPSSALASSGQQVGTLFSWQFPTSVSSSNSRI